MRDLAIGVFLDRVAAGTPAPAGGAVAAVQAAHAAALVEMVAALSGAADAASVSARARELRDQAVGLATEDEVAYGAVAEAFALPRDTGHDRAARSRAIGAALVRASEPPAAVVEVAAHCLALVEALLPGARISTLADLHTAAEAARAAAVSSGLNVETNLAGRRGASVPESLTAAPDAATTVARRAEAATASIRNRLRGASAPTGDARS